jgi:tetratricopeptide (TPR) repeat protein
MSSNAADRSKLLEKAAGALTRGELDTAVKLYMKVFDEDPNDWNVGNTLGDLYVRAGRNDDAVSHFTMLAEQLAADGFTARARALYRKIVRLQPDDEAARLRVDELDRQQVGAASPFLKRVMESARTKRDAEPVPSPVAGPTFAEADAAATAALAQQDYHTAAARMREFISSNLSHVAALERLVGICVDGGLETELVAAQQWLADACLGAGQFRQAFDIALDLCAREPAVSAHHDRAERVVVMARAQGVELAMPRVIAFDEQAIDTETPPAIADPRPVPPPVATAVRAEVPKPEPEPGIEMPAPPAIASPPPVVPGGAVAIGPPFGDLLKSWSDSAAALEDIQQALLEDAATQSEERFAQASRLIAARQPHDAIAPLEDAMCLPHLRASAGSRLARIYRDTGEPAEALTLLEWVAEMPPADEDSGHELAYELALTLEALGQESEALGVYRELLAEVGPSYRDIATRAQKLTAA